MIFTGSFITKANMKIRIAAKHKIMQKNTFRLMNESIFMYIFVIYLLVTGYFRVLHLHLI